MPHTPASQESEQPGERALTTSRPRNPADPAKSTHTPPRASSSPCRWCPAADRRHQVGACNCPASGRGPGSHFPTGPSAPSLPWFSVPGTCRLTSTHRTPPPREPQEGSAPEGLHEATLVERDGRMGTGRASRTVFWTIGRACRLSMSETSHPKHCPWRRNRMNWASFKMWNLLLVERHARKQTASRGRGTPGTALTKDGDGERASHDGRALPRTPRGHTVGKPAARNAQ